MASHAMPSHLKLFRAIALLIRPDGYVAWAAERVGDAERDELREAVTQWFQPRPLTSATR